MNKQGIIKSISTLFPTGWHNATKFGVNQVLMAITLASISGISRICKIAAFSGDGLVKTLLKLDKGINENAISTTLKKLGQSGARKLQILLLSKNARWLHESGLESITLDADSTVKSVCGNQEGAKKGFNTTKKGAKSHPLLVFVSEVKLLYHTWFRTGSAYTSNGIVDFLKEVGAGLPTNITKVFFRADSGFFSGELFDLLESFGWDYLVKVKLKNLAMAGATLTSGFWANDILWQLGVFAYNISVMIRQKKSKFKRQEHRTFIDWFISVPAKIIRSGHQMELKLHEHYFYKADREELDRLVEAA